MEKTLLTRDETLDTASKLRKSMKLRNEIEFSETRMKTPDIDFYEDEEQFFDPSVWEIHIGSIGITNRFEAEDEKDFAKALEFVQGHESQHVHSTASKPYAWGIQRGTEVIMEYIASIEDPKRKFRREKDYERYAEELNNKGIYISWQSVRQMVAGISNSIEDGRIEGIRASKFKGFAKFGTKIENSTISAISKIIAKYSRLHGCGMYFLNIFFLFSYSSVPHQSITVDAIALTASMNSDFLICSSA